MKKFLNKFSVIFETALFPICLVVVILVPTLFLTKKDSASIIFPVCLVFVTFMSYAYWKILDLQRAIVRLQNYCLSIIVSDGLKEVATKIDTILNYSPEEKVDITKEVFEIIALQDNHNFADANKIRDSLSIPSFILDCIIFDARQNPDMPIMIIKPKKGEKLNE